MFMPWTVSVIGIQYIYIYLYLHCFIRESFYVSTGCPTCLTKVIGHEQLLLCSHLADLLTN